MQRNIGRACVVASVALLVRCDRPAPTWKTAEVDAEVYAAVLNRMLQSSALKADSVIVLLDSTVTIPRRVPLPGRWDNTDPIARDESLTVRRFEAAAQLSHTLRPLEPALRRRLRMRLVFADEQDYSRIEVALDAMTRVAGRSDSTTEWYWRAFYERYPGSMGAVSLSAIGYNSTGDQAVLYVDRSCGPLCGHGYIVLVKRDETGWHLARVLQQWVS